MIFQGEKKKKSKNESIYFFPAKILKHFIFFMSANVFLKWMTAGDSILFSMDAVK